MLGQTELIHRAHDRVDDAKDKIDTETLAHDARAKSSERIGVGKIGVATFLQLRSLPTGEEPGGQRIGLLRREWRCIRPDRLKNSVQSPNRGRVYAKMNIGRARLLPDRQVIIDMGQGMRPRGVAGGFRGHDAEIMRPELSRKSKSSHYFLAECELPA